MRLPESRFGVRKQAKPVHGHEDEIDAGEGEPEMKLAKRLVESAAKEFWKPEKQCAEDGERSGDTHDEMEMSGDEFVADGRGGEIASREEDSRNSAGHEERNETDGEQHRGVELDARVPERAEPTDQQNRCGQTERGSQERKDQR